eukprot:jgi/Chlat1/867/Chrsp107S01337
MGSGASKSSAVHPPPPPDDPLLSPALVPTDLFFDDSSVGTPVRRRHRNNSAEEEAGASGSGAEAEAEAEARRREEETAAAVQANKGGKEGASGGGSILQKLGLRKRSADAEVTEYIARKKQLKTVPAEVWHYGNIETLDLSWNNLQAVPAGLFPRVAKNLRTLNLSYNELANSLYFLPDSLPSLSSLLSLRAAHNRLTSVPHELRNFALLKTLDLSHNNINRLGRTVGTLEGVEEIRMGGNKVPAMPRDIGKLRKLRVLELANNRLTALPSDIGLCTALEHLDLSHNSLGAIPKELSHCLHLRLLLLSGNKLKLLPPDLGYLTSLQVLDASHNALVALVMTVTAGKGGKHTHAHHQQWRELRRLDVGYNNLEMLPAAIGRLPKLEELNVEGNTQLRVPPQVTVRGTAAIMCYLNTVGEQMRAVDDYLERFTYSNVEQNEALLDSVTTQQKQETQALAQLSMELAVSRTSTPSVISPERREELARSVAATRKRLEDDPRLARIALPTLADK